MLVLTRKPGEQIVIRNGEEEIRITLVRGDRVRIGIDAGKHWNIVRTEIADEEPARQAGGTG